MEKRGCTLYISKNAFFGLFFLLVLYSFFILAECRVRSVDHISSESPLPPRAHKFRNEFGRVSLTVVFGVVTGLIGAVIFAFIVKSFVRYINRTPILKGPVIFSPKVDPKTLQSALANETQLLSSSPHGKYYKTVLDNGLTIAVKRLEPFESDSPKAKRKSVKRQLQRELEVLASLRNRNLMSLRAYVREPDRFALVYDYVPAGSLEDAMKGVRENHLQLGWDIRLRIAVGVIKALQYLHFTCNPLVLHCNLKPSNVMLDSDFEPRLADCGLVKLLPSVEGATSCYKAPECFQGSRHSDKSDIFSFGMILSVLLTSRNPTDPFFEEPLNGGSLGRWLRHLQQAGDAREALDKSILGQEVEEDEMLMTVRIAVACLSDSPAERPSSDELVSMLTQLHSF